MLQSAGARRQCKKGQGHDDAGKRANHPLKDQCREESRGCQLQLWQ